MMILHEIIKGVGGEGGYVFRGGMQDFFFATGMQDLCDVKIVTLALFNQMHLKQAYGEFTYNPSERTMKCDFTISFFNNDFT